MTELGPTLADLRGEIDRLDDALVDLLLERARIVADIAPLKAEAGASIVRPGREAEVLRRLVARAGDGFDRAALVRIWREIMTAALRIQGPFSVAVSAPGDGPGCWGLARDQYGAATPMTAASSPASAIAMVMAGNAAAAVLPVPATEEEDPWWPRLLSESEGAPRVIVRLPVAEGMSPVDGCPEGMAVAAVAPERSGDDRSLVAVETVDGVSRTRILAAVTEVGLTGCFVAVWRSRDQGVFHLFEVEGFVAEEAAALARLRVALGGEVRRLAVIGSYAVPLALPPPAGVAE